MTAARRLALLPVLLTTHALACGDGPLTPPDALPDPLRSPAVATGSWARVERPGFSFLLPPGFEDLGLQPIDSDAAVYARGADSRLHYDYGMYSGPLEVPAGATEVVRDVRTRIGGREVTLVSYRHDGLRVVGARWAGLGRMGAAEIALVMLGSTPSADVRSEILAAIHSVEIGGGSGGP